MGVALAVYRRVNVEDSVVAGFHLLNQNRGAVRNLLVAEAEDLLADKLGGDNALGLVGEGVVVKEMTALGRLLFQLVEQLVHAASVLSTDGYDRLEVIKLRVGEDLLHQLVLLPEHVDFVDREDRGHADRFELFNQRQVRGRGFLAGFDHEHAAVNTAYALVHRANHVFAESVLWLVHTGCVKKHDLVLAVGQHARDAVARGLGL